MVRYLLCSWDLGRQRRHVSFHVGPAFNYLYNSLLLFCFLLIFCELPEYVTKYVQSTFELFLSQYYLLLSFNKVLKQNFPLPIRSAKGKLYSHWEQTRAGNGSPCHHTGILLRETDGENGKARRRKHRCPQRTTDRVSKPLAPETRGSITSASAGTGPLCCSGVGSGLRVGTECRREGSPWVPGRGGLSDALGSVHVHACVWELFMLVNTFIIHISIETRM